MAAARSNRRRRRSRGRFGPLLKLLCAAAVVVALTVGATVFFRVETVEVTGNSRYTQEEVAAASGIELGDNLYAMNKFSIQRQIRELLPYVSEVSIRRDLPSTIRIQVTECQAAARVMPSASAQAPEGETPDGEGVAGQERADEAWLISVTGKLLEPAPADSQALEVSGLTLLMPRAGTALAVPQEEEARSGALLALLAALEKTDMLSRVSAVEVGSTRMTMRYLDRFDVELLLGGDFDYLLQVLTSAVADLDQRVGPTCTGTLDLTREDAQAVYSPGE